MIIYHFTFTLTMLDNSIATMKFRCTWSTAWSISKFYCATGLYNRVAMLQGKEHKQ